MSRLSRITAPAVLALFLAMPAAAQYLAGDNLPSLEHQELEEAHIKSKEEHGESHASGMRAELGPVILGNPTQAHTLIRVGLSYSFTPAGAVSEFATRHHPFAEISHTAGTVHLIDGGSGKQIVDLEPGTIVRATRDANGYQVSVA